MTGKIATVYSGPKDPAPGPRSTSSGVISKGTQGHIRRALQNGVTKDEIRGLITHLAFYAGWPTGVNAARVALEVFEES